jgi:hypothetical protein
MSDDARKYSTLFKVGVTVAVLLVSGVGTCSEIFFGYLITTSIFADPVASYLGQVIGGLVGFVLAI